MSNSNVIDLHRYRRKRRSLSFLNGGSDGEFVLHSDAGVHPLEVFGPFRSIDEAREFAIDAAEQINADIAWATFPRRPNDYPEDAA